MAGSTGSVKLQLKDGFDEDKKKQMVKELLEGKSLNMDDVFEAEQIEEGTEKDESDAFESFREEMASALIDTAFGDSNQEDSDETLGQFDSLKKKMVPVLPNKGVLKKTVKEGEGVLIPKGSVVTVHYSAYLEDVDEPYDSTALQNRPKKFRTDHGEVVLGLDIAVQSMRKCEKALFLVEPVYNLREGVPPRVPRNASVLLEVEVLNWIDSNSAEAYEVLPKAERQKAPFAVLCEAVKSQRTLGNEAFTSKRFPAAVSCYRKAINWLENYRYNNEEDEVTGTKLRLFLHLNTAKAYLDMGEPRPPQAIVQCREALNIDPNNVKALYRLGEAFRLLGECDKAKTQYIRAQKVEPNNQVINNAITLINDKIKRQQKEVKQFCQNMFKKPTKPNNCAEEQKEFQTDVVVDSDFLEAAKMQIEAFLNDENASEMAFPMDMTLVDRACVASIAKLHDLRFECTPTASGIKDCRIVKKNVNQ